LLLPLLLLQSLLRAMLLRGLPLQLLVLCVAPLQALPLLLLWLVLFFSFFFILVTWGSRQITSRTLTLCASGLAYTPHHTCRQGTQTANSCTRTNT
jgi:hypothetical protein